MLRSETPMPPTRSYLSLNLKIARVYGIVALFGSIVILGLSYLGSIRSVYRASLDRVTSLADSIAYSAGILAVREDQFTLQRLVEKAGTLDDVIFVTVTDTTGKTLAHNIHSEIGKIQESALITSAIHQDAAQQQITGTHISFVLPVHGPAYNSQFGDITGALWIEMDFQNSLATLQREFLLVGLFGVLVMVVIYPIFYLTTRYIVLSRLVNLQNGLQRVEKGDLSVQIAAPQIFGSQDEINLVIQQFNQMTGALTESQTEIGRQRDFAQQVMNSMGQGLAILDPEGRLIYANPAFAALVLCPTEKLAHRPMSDFIIGENCLTQKLASGPNQSAENAGPSTCECRIQRSDGEILHVLVSSALRVGHESTTELITVFTDLTERTRLEQMKSDFVNRASHELRTPLTTALLMVHLLDGAFTSGEEVEYWGALKESLEEQRELVESLLTLGRIESGHFQVAITPTDLNPILTSALKNIAPLAQKKNIRLVWQIEPDLPLVSGNTTALGEVFANLLSNAVKFSKDNETVNLTAQANQEGVLITIQDHGIGIPEFEIPHLFNRFFRASNATSNEIQGSGLGLYIVQVILKELKGSVSVQSKAGEGSAFSVFLPQIS